MTNLKLLRWRERDETGDEGSVPEPYTMTNPALTQTQSAFLRLVPRDVRIMIHELVLSDPKRLLHIVPYRGTNCKKHMGNWRCNDEASPFPTWQHNCFGEWADENGKHQRWEPRSNGNLVSWVLTCRSMYLEAIEILYTSNVFSFRGAAGLLCFKQPLPAHNWALIRRLSISTVFQLPMASAPGPSSIPPENSAHWEEACTAIATLKSLQQVTIDMTIWGLPDRNLNAFIGPTKIPYDVREMNAFTTILGPLRAIRAREMEVEVNVEVPDCIEIFLGPMDFTIVQRQREYNGRVYPRY